MKIRYNQLVLILIVTSVGAAVTHFLLAKTRKKCLTCVCKNKDGKTHITEPSCNFDSITTKKSIDDLPQDIKNECKKKCDQQDMKYANHFLWSE